MNRLKSAAGYVFTSVVLALPLIAYLLRSP